MSETIWLHGLALAGLPYATGPEDRQLKLPGHLSAPVTEPTVAAMAEALRPDLPKRFALVGHSLGGMVALTLATTNPERCRALVLVDMPLRIPRWLLPDIAAMLAPWNCHALMRWVSAHLVAARTNNSAIRPAVRDAIRGMSADGLARGATAACRFDGRVLLPKLIVPTLALFGTKSILTNAAMQRELAQCPGVTCQTLRTGHMLPFEDRPGFEQAVMQFLKAHP